MKVEDNDFGFFMISEEEALAEPTAQVDSLTTKLAQAEQENRLLNERLETVHKMILPLISNLKRDPEKPFIKWPNRVAKLNEFERKITNVVKGFKG